MKQEALDTFYGVEVVFKDKTEAEAFARVAKEDYPCLNFELIEIHGGPGL